MSTPVLKVSQLNRYVKSQIETDERLRDIYVAGEISNLTANRASGHLYFSLRDELSSVKCVMFAGNTRFLRFMPQSGMAVVVRGYASLYERDGAFQIIVQELLPDGAGSLGFAFERQKKMLAAKGYFDESHKKPLPQNPVVIGVVTSESGAALHDIISVFERRNPSAKLVFASAQVQGATAAKSVANAIAALERDGQCQLLIVGRGGGSAEDLWAFNEEKIVKAVYKCKIPVISAVGHETDITLCDLAADFRAATPTAAAEIAAGDAVLSKNVLANYKLRLENCMQRVLQSKEKQLFEKINSEEFKNPYFILNKNRQILNNLIKSMYMFSQNILSARESDIKSRAALLESLSPLKVLSRGYCVAERENCTVVSAKALALNDKLSLMFSDGTALVTVDEVILEEEK